MRWSGVSRTYAEKGTDVAHHDGDIGVGAGTPDIGRSEVRALVQALQSPRAKMPEQCRGEDLVIIFIENPPPVRLQDRAVERDSICLDHAADLDAKVRLDVAQQPRLVPDFDVERRTHAIAQPCLQDRSIEVSHDDDEPVARGAVVHRIFPADAVHGFPERQPIVDLDKIGWCAPQGDDDVGKGARRPELHLARRRHVLRRDPVFANVAQPAQFAAQLLKKQTKLAVDVSFHAFPRRLAFRPRADAEL
jgi:hypothetical protein